MRLSLAPALLADQKLAEAREQLALAEAPIRELLKQVKFAGYSGILDLCRDTLCSQGVLQTGHKAVRLQQPQTGGERIAQRHDLHRGLLRWRLRGLRVRRACPGEQGQATNGCPRDLDHSPPPPI